MQPDNNDWRTPARFVDAARIVMGGVIDLDPASSEEANRTVRATRYYTKEQNGLLQDWTCRSMWLNPPYGVVEPKGSGRYKGGGSSRQNKSLQVLFVNKALAEFKAGNIEQLILLVTANLTCPWFQPLYDYPMCIPFPKLRFVVSGLSETQRQVFGNAVVYLGTNKQRFMEIFSQFGPIIGRICTPPANLVTRELWTEVNA